MPNFQTNSLAMPNFPVKFGDSHFKYIAISPRGEYLVKTESFGVEFFLQIKKKGDRYLVKGDKISRPSQVVFLQKALKDFRDLTDSDTTFSNIEFSKQKTTRRYKSVVDIDFFAYKFNTDKDIYIEVGFGSGRHLLYQAKKHPEKILIGLEIHKPSLEQVAKQCELQEINNILLLDYDARIFLEFLKSNSVEKIFVHFPVPWDKKPHRRVISEDFINEAIRVLRDKGTLELRTDSDNYFEYSFGEFMKLNKSALHVNKNQDLPVSSKYEDRWKRLEKNIYDIVFVNSEISEEKEKIEKLAFSEQYDFSKVKEKFRQTVMREGESFVHIEDIFTIDEKTGILKLSFGASFKNERAYIIFSEENTCYFPDNVLATRDNKQAHKLIREWLNGTCS